MAAILSLLRRGRTLATLKRPKVTIPAVAAIVVWSLVSLGVVSLGAMAPLLFSAMVFDAPGSEHNPWLWTMVGALAAVPLLSLISVPGCVLALVFEFKRPWAATWIWVLAALPLLAVLAFAVALLGLQFACDGSFSCGY